MSRVYTKIAALGRRGLLAALAAPAVARAAPAATPLLRLATGPRGSGAERYGAALCAEMGQAAAVRLAPRHTLGSVENLYLLEAGQVQFAIAGLEVTLAAWAGGAGFAPRRLRRLRVLAPVYGLPVLLHARPGLAGWSALAGLRVGCGPAGGAGEAVLRGATQALGLAVEPVVDGPAELGAMLRAGALDALVLAGGQDAGGFGPLAGWPLLPLAAAEAAPVCAALPGLAPALLPGNVPGLAAWTLLLAQAGLAEAWAGPVAELALAWPPALRAALPEAVLQGAGPEANAALPWHGGAYAAWARAGMSLPEAPP